MKISSSEVRAVVNPDTGTPALTSSVSTVASSAPWAGASSDTCPSHAYGTVRAVQEQFGGTTYRVTHTGVVPASHHYTVASSQPAGEGLVSELAPVPGADETTVLTELVRAGVAVSGFTTARTSLEEIFIRVYGADSLQNDEAEMAGVGA